MKYMTIYDWPAQYDDHGKPRFKDGAPLELQYRIRKVEIKEKAPTDGRDN